LKVVCCFSWLANGWAKGFQVWQCKSIYFSLFFSLFSHYLWHRFLKVNRDHSEIISSFSPIGFKLIASFFISRLFAQLCEVYKSVDFLVVICWDVILMATRRDFEASKERPCCSTVSEPHAHCCTWGYAWGSCDACWDCWQAH
jgi:hypothetical protein